jgi:hypothetical protein
VVRFVIGKVYSFERNRDVRANPKPNIRGSLNRLVSGDLRLIGNKLRLLLGLPSAQILSSVIFLFSFYYSRKLPWSTS